MDNKRISWWRHLFGLFGLVVVLGVIAALWLNRQAVTDWWRLQGYNPPAAIVALADDDSMTAEARHDFYVNRPELKDKNNFNEACSKRSEHTIVLGCYVEGQNGIYILKVNDSRLQGVEQVTAAHEMLHAAYDRLDGKEKRHINDLLMKYYRHGLKDERILGNLEVYRETEPNQVVNEMHSIFGTEITNLPAPLERYYKRYFTNRAKIANYAITYQSEFTSRENEVKSYDTQLTNLKLQIDQLKIGVAAGRAKLDSLRNEMSQQRHSGNTDAYNQNVTVYNRAVDDYNAKVERLKSQISRYNQLVNQRNAIVLEEQELSQAIDSHAETMAPQ